jgi:phage terminase large subunit-like protein
MSTLKAIASDTKTMDGQRPFFCLTSGTKRDSKVYDVMIQSQASQSNHLQWLLSTNGFVREMFFDDKYHYCSKSLYGNRAFEIIAASLL